MNKYKKENPRNKKEYYNYKYWREIQRNQLTISSNIVFTFSVAIIGFIVNYLLEKNINKCPLLSDLFYYSILFLLFSIISYFLMNIVKLKDYRLTSKLINKKLPFNQIAELTSALGKLTWYLFYVEIIFAFLGFIITLFTFKNIIFY